jgi:hypothetical protein
MTTKPDNKICFVISPIGEEDSETRKRSDTVLKHIICAAVEQVGYDVIRADKISEPGIITTQIIQYIVDSSLVIADLTERNPNVFYELALRHAIRKPLVQLIKKGEPIPFDVAATRIIQFDIHDLDSVDYAKSEIISQVKTIEAGNSDMHNPISVSLDLKMLKESGNPEERSLADVVEAISDLRLAVDKKLSSPDSVLSAKLLDEFKLVMENLLMRVESKLDPDYKRRRRKLHPIILEEMMHGEIMREDVNFSFLMMLSLFKEDFPWLYEIGIETYRDLKSAKTKVEKKKLVETFEKSLEMLGHPMMKEIYGKSEDVYMLAKELRHFLHRFIDRYISQNI